MTRALRLFTISYSILALELTLIRWMSQQVRVFAYFTNVLIIAAFLGIGVGAALGRRGSRLIHAALPLAAALSVVLAFSDRLRLMFLSFPDISITMWGAEGLKADETFAFNVAVMLGLFAVVSAIFAAIATSLGDLFDSFAPIRAYAIDLSGSVAGVIAATVVSRLNTSPPVWLLVALAPVAIWHSRTLLSWFSLAVAVVFAWVSIDGALFSPYSRIDVIRKSPTAFLLSANRDQHQQILDLSVRGTPMRDLYDTPFNLTAHRGRALIVGAGAGNDVAAALRNGFSDVVAVEIDPVIRDVGRKIHPEKPYASPHVKSVVADARTYFEANRDQRFDVVCFGLLDSHAMFSSMSTLRLDNYVYTVEALSRAYSLVSDGGVMVISFMVFRQQFIASRLAANLEAATGQRPLVAAYRTGANVFVVGKGVSRKDLLARLKPGAQIIDPPRDIRLATDDWPFLYLRPHTRPKGYIAVFAGILLLAFAAVRFSFRGSGGVPFDAPLFFLGAAFLLLETRSITNLSLLFGSTWLVNAAVFAGVLLIALLSNGLVARGATVTTPLVFALFASLALNFAVTNTWLSALPLMQARVAGVVLNVLPIGIAGVIFSALLARSATPAASLGSNLLGAVAGGIVEYTSMVVGLRALVILAAVFYAIALMAGRRRTSGTAVA